MLAMRGALKSPLRRLSVSVSSTLKMRHLFIQPGWAHHLRSKMFKYVAVDDNQVLVNLNKPPRGIVVALIVIV